MHEADFDAFGHLASHLDVAVFAMECERRLVRRINVDFERQPERLLSKSAVDFGVQRRAKSLTLRSCIERNPVEIEHVVVALHEPEVVHGVVARTLGEHDAKACNETIDVDHQRECTLLDEKSQPVHVGRPDLGHIGLVDLQHSLEVGCGHIPNRHAGTVASSLSIVCVGISANRSAEIPTQTRMRPKRECGANENCCANEN